MSRSILLDFIINNHIFKFYHHITLYRDLPLTAKAVFYLLSSIGFKISGLFSAKLFIRLTISLAGFDQRLWSSSITFSF